MPKLLKALAVWFAVVYVLGFVVCQILAIPYVWMALLLSPTILVADIGTVLIWIIPLGSSRQRALALGIVIGFLLPLSLGCLLCVINGFALLGAIVFLVAIETLGGVLGGGMAGSLRGGRTKWQAGTAIRSQPTYPGVS
jgi:hypothetical protein